MSGSKQKVVRRQQNVELVKDLEQQIEAATKAQADKLEQSKAHLVAQLEGAAGKYLTVNGYMSARTIIEQATFGDQEGAEAFGGLACDLAREMSGMANRLAELIFLTSVSDLNEEILDELLDERFVDMEPMLLDDVARQLMVVGMLQNVGPALSDIVTFREGSNEGIQKLKDELAAQSKSPELTVVETD